MRSWHCDENHTVTSTPMGLHESQTFHLLIHGILEQSRQSWPYGLRAAHPWDEAYLGISAGSVVRASVPRVGVVCCSIIVYTEFLGCKDGIFAKCLARQLARLNRLEEIFLGRCLHVCEGTEDERDMRRRWTSPKVLRNQSVPRSQAFAPVEQVNIDIGSVVLL